MKSLSLILALAASAQAALRFGCSQLTIQRLDPLVQPGSVPSGHVHQVVGGNVFNATMSGNVGDQGSCTTCVFSEDFSNYWTAALYFKHTNGSYKRVPIMENDALPAGMNGGMTIYYTQQDFNGNGNQKITAFPAGFRMTVGSPSVNTQSGLQSNPGLRFVCLQNKDTRFPEQVGFPTGKCQGGIMTVHHFPACWNGKDLDSPNHQDHMYNTQPGAFQPAGACPSSHPIRMPQVAYETLYDTTQFNNMWPTDGSNPLYLSYGDNHGYGTHADYVFGWKGDALQRAMDSSCMFTGCENGNPLKSQGVAQMNACAVKKTVGEDVDGWLPSLPGMSM